MPHSAIYSFLCNGMDRMEVVQLLGFFGPIPTLVLRSYLSINTSELRCPLTYVMLTNDKVFSPESQAKVAERFEGTETIKIDSCHQVMAQRPHELAEVLLRYA